MEFIPKDYQKEAVEFIITNSSCGIFLEAVMERTAIVLTALRELLYDYFRGNKVLIITSNILAKQVWCNSIKKWDNLEVLKYSHVTGTEKQRVHALKRNADIYLMNIENISWLVQCGLWTFDTLILDELEKYKNEKSSYFQKVLSLRPRLKYLIGVGTMPIDSKLEDLWAECYLLDGGIRLGKSKKGFLERYFFKNWEVVNDRYRLRIEAKNGAKEAMIKAVGDLIYCIDSQKDVSKKSPQDIYIEMSPVEYSKYHWLESKLMNESVDVREKYSFRRMMTLLRVANGIWDEMNDGKYFHERKLNALDKFIKANGDKNILIACCFIQDREEIRKRYFSALYINSHNSVEQWNQNKYRIGVISPFSKEATEVLALGTDILIWYSLPWSYHAYERLNVNVNNEVKSSQIMRMIMLSTIEERVLLLLNRSSVERKEIMECLLRKGES